MHVNLFDIKSIHLKEPAYFEPCCVRLYARHIGTNYEYKIRVCVRTSAEYDLIFIRNTNVTQMRTS